MAELVELKPRPTRINEGAVALLREYLEMAENGQIGSIGIVAVHPDGTTRSEASQGDWLQTLIGALAMLQFRLIASAYDMET